MNATRAPFLTQLPVATAPARLRKDVRPDESQRKAPAVCVYSRFARSSGRGGVTIVARCLKAALRDALGKASTGQGLDLDLVTNGHTLISFKTKQVQERNKMKENE